MLLNKLKNIRLVILDIDGVLTDGGIIYNDNGVETKIFNVSEYRTGVSVEQVAFMGDDFPDLGLMKKVGLSIAVADAHKTVLKHVDMIPSGNRWKRSGKRSL